MKTRDLVCRMEIDEQQAPAWAAYKGQVYHFCSNDCRIAFQKEPHRYLPRPAPPTPIHTGPRSPWKH